MNSSSEKDEENLESKSDVSVEIIPYDLLEKLNKRNVWGSALKKIRTKISPSKPKKPIRECIFKPTNERRVMTLLPSKPEDWFTIELASAFRLKHENIIRVYGRTSVGRVNGVVTEWVEGISLERVIHDESISYTFADVLRWNIQSFSALEYVIQIFPGEENEYFRRYFNRIVCAENMILNPTRDVLKICALGLLKDIPDPEDFEPYGLNKYNYSYYWAPEVWNGEYRYEESDVYPFGVVLWECITRRKPWVFFWSKRIQLGLIEDYYSPVGVSSIFQQFIDGCTIKKPSEDRLPVLVIKTILKNMVPAEYKQTINVLKENIISFWNDQELYYCKKLIPFKYSSKNVFKQKVVQNSRIFNYNLLKRLKVLGRGNFGQVHLAEYEGEQIAVKFQIAMKIEPFLQEFSLLNQLKHKNIVKVIGQTEEAGVYGIVMEYIDGTSLDKIIHESPAKYTLGDVLTWNYQAVSALDYIHFRQCLHRDVKPANMLIENSEKRTLKIVDLGGAKMNHNSLNYSEMGTWSYIAPEIENNEPYNEFCDVYSWTITFWECCTAQKPQKPPEYRSKVNQICSTKFVEIIEKCSSSKPLDRKPMWSIKKWLKDLLKNRQAFSKTDLTFRENCVCVWNEQTNELYYSGRTESDQRFQNDLIKAKASFVNVPIGRYLIYDIYTGCEGWEDKNRITKYIIKQFPEKVIIAQFSKDADEKHLEKEFLILSKLKHENILQLAGYTHDYELNYFGIITEDFRDPTLEKIIDGGCYTTEQIIKWSLQTARGLEYMHSQNILHCDFKPANILRNVEEELKIFHFELARDLQYEYPKEAVGTGLYMAPEVRRDGLLTKMSDVYSWTVTFWEFCVCQGVKPTDEIQMTIEDIRQKESIDLCEAKKGHRIENGSDKFNQFIQACANEDPDKRWSMTDIATVLENMIENRSKSNYLPDLDNIETDKVIKDNICLWTDLRMRKLDPRIIKSLIKIDFFYASPNFSLDLPNWTDSPLNKS